MRRHPVSSGRVNPASSSSGLGATAGDHTDVGRARTTSTPSPPRLAAARARNTAIASASVGTLTDCGATVMPSACSNSRCSGEVGVL